MTESVGAQRRVSNSVNCGSFNRWWVLFAESLQFLDWRDLSEAERVCKKVYQLVGLNGFWKSQFNAYRLSDAPDDPPIPSSSLQLSEEPKSQGRRIQFTAAELQELLRCRREWKRRLLQYSQERNLRMQASIGLIFDERPTATATIIRLPLQRGRVEARQSVNGLWESPVICQPPNLPASSISIFLFFDRRSEFTERLSIYLHFTRGEGQLIFEFSFLGDEFNNCNPDEGDPILRSSRYFSPQHETIGWQLPPGFLANRDMRLLTQLLYLPKEITLGDLRKVERSGAVQVLRSPRYGQLFKLSVLKYFGELVKVMTQTNRRRLQRYIVADVLQFAESLKLTSHLVFCCAELWNMLDTSPLDLSDGVVDRAVGFFCSFGRRCYLEGFASPTPSDFARRGIGTAFGVLWNIPISPLYTSFLSQRWEFFEEAVIPLLMDIKSQGLAIANVFSGLHLLVAIAASNSLPEDRLHRALQAIDRSMTLIEAENITNPNDLGVSMTSRDAADFFIPLLRSRHLECVRFGAWCLNYYFFKAVEPVAPASV